MSKQLIPIVCVYMRLFFIMVKISKFPVLSNARCCALCYLNVGVANQFHVHRIVVAVEPVAICVGFVVYTHIGLRSVGAK